MAAGIKGRVPLKFECLYTWGLLVWASVEGMNYLVIQISELITLSSYHVL